MLPSKTSLCSGLARVCRNKLSFLQFSILIQDGFLWRVTDFGIPGSWAVGFFSFILSSSAMLIRLVRLSLAAVLILAGVLGGLWLIMGRVMTEGLMESLGMRLVSAAWRRSFDSWDMEIVLFDFSFV